MAERWQRARRVLSAAAVLGLAGVLAITGGQSAQAYAPPPLPVNLSSELGALMDAGMSASDAAAAAGATGVVATGGAAATTTAGVALSGLVGGFLIGSAGTGALVNASTGSSSGLCGLGQYLGTLYGQDCSTASLLNQAGSKSNQDQWTITWAKSTFCMKSGGTCFTPGTKPVWSGPFPNGTVSPGLELDVSSGTALTQATVCPSGGSMQAGMVMSFPDGQSASGSGGPQWSSTSDTTSASFKTCGTGQPHVNAYTPASVIVFNALTPVANANSGGLEAASSICLSVSPATGTAAGTCSSSSSGNTYTDTGSATLAGTNPSRYFKTIATYSDGSIESCQSATFTEQDATLPDFCTPAKGATAAGALVSIQVQEWLADGTGYQVVFNQSATTAYSNAASAYPDCAQGACQLQLYLGSTACTVGASGCAGWFSASPRASGLKCVYGPTSSPTEYSPPIGECDVLAHYYDPASQTSGAVYSNPKTGAAVGGSTTDPSTAPSSGTSSGGITASGGQDCLGDTVTADPLTWVTGPVECALQWAFVPSQTQLQTEQAQLTSTWNSTAIASTANAVVALFPTSAPSSTCAGFTLSLDPVFSLLPGGGTGHTINVANACSPPISTIAALCNIGIMVAVGVSGALAMTRYIGALVNFRGAGDSDT